MENTEKKLQAYYMLLTSDGLGKIFVTQAELDKFFDIKTEKYISTPIAHVNLNKPHDCCKIGRDGVYPTCTCERFDSWMFNRHFTHVKGNLPFGPGTFATPIILLGVLHVDWS